MMAGTLRSRLLWIFLLGTLVPIAAVVWVAESLLEQSLSYSTTAQVDWLSKLLERTGREYYQASRELLKQDALNGASAGTRYRSSERAAWPAEVRVFAESDENETFRASGENGERLSYMVRDGSDVLVFERPLRVVSMGQISSAIRGARGSVEEARYRDLRRGFLYTIVLITLGIWAASMTVLALAANRVTRPIRDLTGGLATLARGDLSVRLPVHRPDEIGEATRAFNRTAATLEESRDRLVQLARMESWQTLARKMAHEVKNSLTPIRLNVEEIVARSSPQDRPMVEQAAQIIIDEIKMMERRVRAFSDLGSEPPVRAERLDLNASVEERILFLRQAKPEVTYQADLAPEPVCAVADPDLVRGILTNLIQNAAEAAGAGGVVMLRSRQEGANACVEIHDSGPGVERPAKGGLFEPTISFKKGGMGLGLSIARKGAMSCGGDIEYIPGELGGAAFRILLPKAS